VKKEKSFSEVEFERVVDNAFDFLEKSLKQIKTEPKFSVINYYSAIELFFKARLLLEHWSLILTNPAIADKNKFLAGDFHSVSLEECHKRLANICQEKNIDSKKLGIFVKIKFHRNQLVHFYHKAHSSLDKKVIDSIMIEQFQGWFILLDLLTNHWEPYFLSYIERIEGIHKLLHVHKEFLVEKYKKLKPRIDAEISSRRTYKDCLICSFHSSRRGDTSDFMVSYKCLVCEAKETLLVLSCPECKTMVEIISDEDGIKCPKCSEWIDKDTLITEYGLCVGYRPKEMSMALDIKCPSCFEDRIVETSKGEYLCLKCNEVYDSYGCCEWCGTVNLGGVSEESFWEGCEFCEGQSGYVGSRDD